MTDPILTPLPAPAPATAPAMAPSAYDRLIDALNRLPRPMMTIGTVAVFAYAMTDPAGFAARMKGLEDMPEALWWLLGGVISFYFGAREAHYFRQTRGAPGADPATPAVADATPADPAALPPLANAALADWQAQRPN